MLKRIAARLWPAVFAALPLAGLAQPAFAQQAPEPSEDSRLFYYSIGLAWSNEIGLEVEAGLQLDLGSRFRLRVSPLNVALIDGDVPHDFYRDGSTCYYRKTNEKAISDECSNEPDTEWRAVVEGDFRLSRHFAIGAGAAYQLQGDFKPEDGRVSGFASFSWEGDEGIAVQLRAGPDYAALQVRQKF